MRLSTWRNGSPMRAFFSVGVECVWFGRQVLLHAMAFNANIASRNVLRVTTYSSAFDNVGLPDCIKRGVYDNWGSTLQAYPTWSSLSSVCATPTSTPTLSPTSTYACVCMHHSTGMHD